MKLLEENIEENLPDIGFGNDFFFFFFWVGHQKHRQQKQK